VKKLTGDFDNGLGAVLIGERSSASFLSKKSREGISGLFQQYRPRADVNRAVKTSEIPQCRGLPPHPDVLSLGRAQEGADSARLFKNDLGQPPRAHVFVYGRQQMSWLRKPTVISTVLLSTLCGSQLLAQNRELTPPEIVNLSLLIDGRSTEVVTHIYRPSGPGAFPIMIFTHGHVVPPADLRDPITADVASW